MGLGMRAWTVEARRSDGHQDPHLHVVVAEGLARKPYLSQKVSALEHFQLRFGHLLRFALEILDAAGGASGVRTTAVQDVYPGIFFDRQDEPLALGSVERPYTFHF
jgi:hypothetical protein